jgi:hypothetical protein
LFIVALLVPVGRSFLLYPLIDCVVEGNDIVGMGVEVYPRMGSHAKEAEVRNQSSEYHPIRMVMARFIELLVGLFVVLAIAVVILAFLFVDLLLRVDCFGGCPVFGSGDYSSQVVLVLGEGVGGDVAAIGEVALRSEADAGEVDDFIVHLVPLAVVHQHRLRLVLLIVNLTDLPPAPDQLSVSDVQLVSLPQCSSIWLALLSPRYCLPQPLLVGSHCLPILAVLQQSLNELAEGAVDGELDVFDAFPAVGTGVLE